MLYAPTLFLGPSYNYDGPFLLCATFIFEPMNQKLSLPILEKKQEILSLLKSEQVIVIAGETGSGKTTQLPQFCLEAGYSDNGLIAVTQPRRIAATSTATRVAEELGCSIGGEIGYKIRFHEKLSQDSKVLFMTDGILLNEIMSDRLLNKYSLIMIDEAHERSLNIDFLLGYIKKILPKRPDLKVIISSATIDTEKFSKFYNNATIISVSGRLFPVETLYLPIDEMEIKKGRTTYVDAAVNAVNEIISMEDEGDILVFMPTEKDITETVQILEGRLKNSCEILPLFARLTRYQQNKIFSTYNNRKVVISTNIAETSLTVPGIKFVVDTGLARIKRYSPRLRTNCLPIDKISQASANQRKGRCGRVAEGLCIRLYEENEFTELREYELPEIKRSNLAGVILNMKSMKIGQPENFPFIEPPDKTSFSDAFNQLKELGAVNSKKELTKLGWQMSRMPLEPHISRMILESINHGCNSEVAIIAAGLSIVDPRERPDEKKESADEAHQQFIDPDSDFITLLNIWNQYQDQWIKLKTQNKLRKFCRDNFLSFNRMVEWHDIHQQIVHILKELKITLLKNKTINSENIHYSILSGLLTNIAQKNEDDNFYRASRGRELLIFPGSPLSKQKKPWVMCQEIVETSRVFGRTVAPIDPLWVEKLAPSLIKYSYSDPFFDEKSNTVSTWQTGTFFGLPVINRRKRPYSKINKEKACRIFARAALAEFQIREQLPFLKFNKSLVNKLESAESKLRTKGYSADIDMMEDFYFSRLNGASSIYDLKRLIRQRGSDNFLRMKIEDMSPTGLPDQAEYFPDHLKIGPKNFALKYAFKPGEEGDGVTVSVPMEDVSFIEDAPLDWLVPALWEEKITSLLRTLPKQKRKLFVPIPSTAEKIRAHFEYEPISFCRKLSNILYEMYNVKISHEEFIEEELPDHLKMQIKVTSKKQKSSISGRDIQSIKDDIKNKTSIKSLNKIDESISSLFKKYEINNITSWNFGDISKKIIVKDTKDGFPLYGFPALTQIKDTVSIKLYTNEEEAIHAHRIGLKHLAGIYLQKEIAWLEKELKFPQRLKLLCAPYGGEKIFYKSLFEIVKDHYLSFPKDLPYTKESFEKKCLKIEEKMKGVGNRVITIIQKSFDEISSNYTLIDKLLKNSTYKKELKKQVEQYIIDIKDKNIDLNTLAEYPRYLKAMNFRIEKAALSASQYKERIEEASIYVSKANSIKKEFTKLPIEEKPEKAKFVQMVEEFMVSLFAQQLGTKFPISTKRLDKQLEKIESI